MVTIPRFYYYIVVIVVLFVIGSIVTTSYFNDLEKEIQSPAPTNLIDKPTHQQFVQKMVDNRIERLQNGTALNDLPLNRSVAGQHYYLFVLDYQDQTMMVYPDEGYDAAAELEAMKNSIEPFDAVIDMLDYKKSAWINYDLYDPNTDTDIQKMTWLRLHDGMIFAAGFALPDERTIWGGPSERTDIRNTIGNNGDTVNKLKLEDILRNPDQYPDVDRNVLYSIQAIEIICANPNVEFKVMGMTWENSTHHISTEKCIWISKASPHDYAGVHSEPDFNPIPEEPVITQRWP